jgi:hypothetical protein
MSKHSSAEDKLHIRPGGRRQKLPPNKANDRNIIRLSGPPAGTNSKNQFR